MEDGRNGLNELIKFAETTLHHLIDLEETQMRRKSGLRVFCRLDIGVIRLNDGSFDYWVNEVDRTSNASLFACGAIAGAETMAIEFCNAISIL